MPLLLFLGLNALALLSYLPWLPTGIERLLNWPSQNGFVGPADGLRLTLHTLAMGSIRSGPQLAWVWLLLVVLLPLLGLWQTRRSDAGAVLLLWLLLPTGVMFTFGLFNPSFLKFLLILSPGLVPGGRGVPSLSLCSILFTPFLFLAKTGVYEKRTGALPVFQLRIISVAIGAVAALAAALAVAALPPYYSDPAARDNYAGMARTVDAVGNPERDLVILNAPARQMFGASTMSRWPHCPCHRRGPLIGPRPKIPWRVKRPTGGASLPYCGQPSSRIREESSKAGWAGTRSKAWKAGKATCALQPISCHRTVLQRSGTAAPLRRRRRPD